MLSIFSPVTIRINSKLIHKQNTAITHNLYVIVKLIIFKTTVQLMTQKIMSRKRARFLFYVTAKYVCHRDMTPLFSKTGEFYGVNRILHIM